MPLKYAFIFVLKKSRLLKVKAKKKKKKKSGGGSLIRAIFWAQNYVSGQSAN